jgi:hypothetical protein
MNKYDVGNRVAVITKDETFTSLYDMKVLQVFRKRDGSLIGYEMVPVEIIEFKSRTGYLTTTKDNKDISLFIRPGDQYFSCFKDEEIWPHLVEEFTKWADSVSETNRAMSAMVSYMSPRQKRRTNK